MKKKSEGDYLCELNDVIDRIMFFAACDYRENGPLGPVDYKIMCNYIKPKALDFLNELIKAICQKLDLLHPSKCNVKKNHNSFANWYDRTCKITGAYKRSSADAIFKKVKYCKN